MRYEFRCETCKAVVEIIQSMNDHLPNFLKCKVKGCTGRCLQIIHAPMLSKTGTKTESFDSVVGRDAERRWANIKERQAQREKVRKESGSRALTIGKENEFKPLKGGHLRAVEIPVDRVNNVND